jgi:peptide/nickel transport system substrate-binding protein
MRGIAFGRRRLLQTSALAGATLAAPRWASAQASTLKIRSIVDIQTLDPAFTYAVHEHNINRAMLHNLITWKKHLSWEWELDAATMVEQVDATHINFALRDDLGWTNGFGAMTAEDVKFSFERIKDPELQSSYQADWALLDHVEVTGERTGTIVMQQPFAPLWNSTLPWVSGFILCKKAIEALPGKRVETEQPATSGPYKVTNWTPKQSLTLGRNELFTGPKPDFDEITFFPVDEDKTAELGFEAGEYDYTGISVSSVPRYRDALPEGAVLEEFPGLDYYWLGINVEHPNFTDPRVRKAVQYALDVPSILEAAFFGVVGRATGYQTPGAVGYRPENQVAARDVEKAKALLAEAGVGDGFSTTITLVNATLWTSMAQVIQANLADVGIQVEIKPYDSGAFWTLGLESEGEAWKDIEMYLQLYNGIPDPAFQTQWFVPEQVGVWNWERWNSPEYKELNDKQLAEFDNAKRDEYVRRMQDLMEDSGAYTFLTNGMQPALRRAWLQPVIRPDGLSMYLPGFKRSA